ncbi:hypothetical protein G6053_15190 [Sphingobacterium sp. DR205]|nr:hypothetical protein G6053_15190 [Sphingobacterium sp. DR205]
MEQIEVLWQGKVNQFPYRIYKSATKNDVETMKDFEKLSLMTRHHDGHIREVAIARLMRLFPLESVPYFVQLLGEYVMEIHLTIIAQITSQQKLWINDFFTENISYERAIRSRIVSYWNCYYRFDFIKLKDYPTFQFLSD